MSNLTDTNINQSLKDKIKQLEQREFNCNTINIFIEANSSPQKQKKGHCIIGIFNKDYTQFLDLLTAKTHTITPGQNIVDQEKIFEQIQFDHDDYFQNEMLTSKFTILGSYLDEVCLARHVDLIVGKDSMKESPAILKFCKEALRNGKITYKDIKCMGNEINNLFIKKYKKEKKQSKQYSNNSLKEIEKKME